MTISINSLFFAATVPLSPLISHKLYTDLHDTKSKQSFIHSNTAHQLVEINASLSVIILLHFHTIWMYV